MPGILNSFFSGEAPALSMRITPGDTQKYRILPYGSSIVVQRVAPSGGVPPYTYLATYLSGDTEIVMSDEDTDTVTFSGTGDGTPINTLEATYEFSVTDSAMTEVTEEITIEFIFGLNPP
jgi:hypothetical protein